MKVPYLDSFRMNRSQLPLHNPFLSPAEHIRRNVQKALGFCEQGRNLEGVLVRNGVDQRDINQDHVVHYAEDGVVVKVSNCSIATDDAQADAQKLPCEYQVSVHGVQQFDVQLLVSQGLVDASNINAADKGTSVGSERGITSSSAQR